MYLENERLVRDQTKIIRLQQGEPLREVLYYLVASLEKQFPIQMYGAIMLYDPNRKELGNMVSSSLPEKYIQTSQPIEIGPYEGSCGTAAFFKKAVIVRDIDHDPYWDTYSDQCKRFGFKACWSIPVISSEKELLGIFALYYKEVYEPNKEIKELLERYSHLATIAIEILGKIEANQEQQRPDKFKSTLQINQIQADDKKCTYTVA